VDRLGDFIERHERHVPRLREELSRSKERFAEEMRAHEESQAAAEAAKERGREQRSKAQSESALAESLARERDAVEHRSERDLPGTGEGTLARAREDYESALSRYQRDFGDSAHEAQRAAYEEQRVGADKRFASARGAHARADLEALSRQVGERLEALLFEAAETLNAEQSARADADAELRAAKLALEGKPRRKREAEDLPPAYAPSTRAHAVAQAEREREAASLATALAAEHRARQEVLERELRDAESRATKLIEQSAFLGTACGVSPAGAAPFVGGTDEAKAVVTALIDAHRGGARRLELATRAAEARAHELARLVHEPRFAKQESAWKQRLLDPFDQLALRAGDMLEQLGERIAALGERIDSIEKDRATLLDSFSGVATDGVHLLTHLERASQMPASLGEWGGHAFLRVKLDVPESNEEKRARLLPLLDELVAQGHIPGGLQLIQRAVRTLQGSREIDAQILKPDAMRRRNRLPIASMSNWSGGERLTAAILLFCTLVNLRAQRRGIRETVSSVLILDNPIGTCSNVALIDLQRTVARAMHTQLVYTTGVDDLAALAQLPNVIRLRNQHINRRTGDGHVTRDEDTPLEGARVIARASSGALAHRDHFKSSQ
jgi:hypothetical protein